ncbi:ATP-dependent bile acid permease [Aspergillus steynii IBT 23096]|uniref:ATP-dependent bile acid permease n=1 Tax=Aspergillus steynii IBT 23096 TaxID=1392250 RepID=A0A2I2FTY1_9EURO|nr:ATP-dependent bile acid permease [Aspergillus steynii IBT 23096]PLB44100.1 ATP-dependent bile acid permease [Aspergillus steynii IBT 23096]
MMVADLPVGASVACLAVTATLSLPHVLRLIPRSNGPPYHLLADSLNDNDNYTAGKSPGSLVQRVVLAVAAGVGTLAALLPLPGDSSAGASWRIARVLQCVAWSLLLIQELILITCPGCRDRYTLGCCSAWASLLLGLTIGGLNARAWRDADLRMAVGRDPATVGVQVVAAAILTLTNLSIPQGPTMYRRGKVVDRRDTVSFLSRYSYDWARPTLALAVRNQCLNANDMPVVAEWVRARSLAERFAATSAIARLWKRCVKIYWPTLVFQLIIQLLSAACRFLPQLALFTLLREFEKRDAGAENQSRLWVTAAGLGGVLMLSSWFSSLVDWVADMHLAVPIREQLFAVITSKVMRLKDVAAPAQDKKNDSPEAANGNDADENAVENEDEDEDARPRTKQSILNLLGVDADNISQFASYNHLALDCTLDLVISIVFLTKLMGWKPTVLGCGLPILLTPVYYLITKRYSDSEEALMEHRDHKSSVLNEAVRGIRQIKFDALESDWYRKIMQLRQKELYLQRSVFRLELSLVSIWSFGPICMSIVSLVAFIIMNGSLSASIAFTALAIFESMESTLAILPEMVTDLLDANVSAQRIERFLALEDHRDNREAGDKISFRKATIAWPSDESQEESTRFSLADVNCEVPTGKLTVISGRSGAGKTLFLHSIIGEAEVVAGSVTVPKIDRVSEINSLESWTTEGRLAYVSQDPWIENATVREAILFGLPWNASRYYEVLNACGLNPDIETFAEGDRTDIGANGINLSGGQKWRLAFARALYSRAQILVLDDIFSAVDSHVGRHLYEKALTGPLCHGRTRILATHHTQLCRGGTAYCIVLGDGRMLRAGTPEELTADGSFSFSLAGQVSEPSNQNGSAIPAHERPTTMSFHGNRRCSTSSGTSLDRRPSRQGTSHADEPPDKYYEDEKRENGAVKAQIFSTYMKACGGYFHWPLIIFLFVLTLADNLAVPYWVSIWTRAYDNISAPSVLKVEELSSRIASPDFVSTSGLQLDSRLAFYVSVYVALSLSSWLLEIFRSLLVFQGSIRASKEFFEQFTNSILRAPLRFLDTTPVGRVLNRFTADFGVLDSDLASNMSYLLHSTILVLGAILAAAVSSPVIVAFGALSLIAAWGVAYLYIAGARESKRLESTARSPIFDQIGALLTGLATIRAFGKEAEYVGRIYDLIDGHCQALWHRWLFASWRSFWLSMVGACFVSAVAVVFVGIRSLDAPLAGFALSFALEMSQNISWLLTEYAQMELDFNAAERIFEYTRLEKESADGKPVPAAWPTKGEVEVTDLYVSYAPDLPPVLKGLNFSVNQGERIGIVGRTGAGKSSLTLALLRFLEAQSGSIHVDGVDLSTIRLHDVRSRIGIIPQDPVVFAGTVREVLDPFDKHDDDELRDALDKIVVEGDDSPGSSNDMFSLSSSIAEGGRNLSQGQRQLLCLARAIVSRPKILVMDEATASVDMESDARIQRSIRQDIHDCTLLVIAHRLSTIADFDRIMVLDQGTVAEFDRPSVLLEKEGGIFRAMVQQSGERAAIEQMINSGSSC